MEYAQLQGNPNIISGINYYNVTDTEYGIRYINFFLFVTHTKKVQK